MQQQQPPSPTARTPRDGNSTLRLPLPPPEAQERPASQPQLLTQQNLGAPYPSARYTSSSVRSVSSPVRRTVAAPVLHSRQVLPLPGTVVSGRAVHVPTKTTTTTTHHSTSPSLLSQHVVHQTGGTVTTTTTQQHHLRPTHGEARVISVNSRVDETRTHIIGEKAVEHQVRVPKKIVHEDVVEHVVVVPEVVRREEVIEEVQNVQERVIEVAKPVIQETVVEVPEYVYVDKIIEVPEVVVREKITHVPRVEIEERVHQVPKYITKEKIVEVPEVEYVEYVVEKVVEIPEVHEQVITTEVPIPQYVDVPVPQYVDVEDYYDVPRNIPVPVESVSTFEYQLPMFKPRVSTVKFPVYLPRFVEVPIAEELLDAAIQGKAEANRQHVALLGEMTQAVSLCEIENLAMQIRTLDVDREARRRDLKEALREAWLNGTVHVTGETPEQKALRTRMMMLHGATHNSSYALRNRSVSRHAVHSAAYRSRSVSLPRSPRRF